jgi:DNA-directed RNA polymerase specialized sigma24 family protein
VNIKTQAEINRTDAAINAIRRSDFALTRWTLVVRSRGDTPEARAALSELCEAYYNPVLSFLRKEGRPEDDARELAQDFFARILSGRGFAGADQTRGRFRSYVLGALKHFLTEARQKAKRQKRGGGLAPESLNAIAQNSNGNASELQIPDPTILPPDAAFDREWALEVMRRSLAALEAEMSIKRKKEQFDLLKPWLAGDTAVSQASAARTLHMSESSFKVTVHRLRKRFGELVRAEIAHTLRDPAQADEELAHLIAALSN